LTGVQAGNTMRWLVTLGRGARQSGLISRGRAHPERPRPTFLAPALVTKCWCRSNARRKPYLPALRTSALEFCVPGLDHVSALLADHAAIEVSDQLHEVVAMDAVGAANYLVHHLRTSQGRRCDWLTGKNPLSGGFRFVARASAPSALKTVSRRRTGHNGTTLCYDVILRRSKLSNE
jgi:hypothetical protein